LVLILPATEGFVAVVPFFETVLEAFFGLFAFELAYFSTSSLRKY
jgi:hypothetical protein